MTEWLTLPAIGGAALIFIMRVADITLYTLRILSVTQGRKRNAWLFGFFQAILYVTVITTIVNNLDNPLNILGYAAGFATGNVVGIAIEKRLAIGYINVQIISPRFGTILAETLRKSGYAVTETSGRGKDGTVTVLDCSVLRKNAEQVISIVQSVDPAAFITSESLRTVRKGFLPKSQ